MNLAAVSPIRPGATDEEPLDLIPAAHLCVRAGITYRQADFWTRTGILTITTRPGTGNPRGYTPDQVHRAALIKRLLDGGLALRPAADAADDLLQTGSTRIAGMTIHLPEQE